MSQARYVRSSVFVNFALGICLAALGLLPAPVFAIPSFARQTGVPSSSSVFPALATFRRQFKLGGGTGLFEYSGYSDMLKYGMGGRPSAMGNATGSPDTRAWTNEGNFLPLKNTQNLKLGLLYTAYAKLNGASDNYSGI